MSKEIVGTVARVVHLLQSLADMGDAISVKALSDRLHLPPSTVHRLLALLMQHGMVERATDPRQYQIGGEFVRIGALVTSKIRIAEFARPFMTKVREACGEVCFFVRYLPAAKQVMIVDMVNSSHPLRYEIEMFKPTSLLWGATGRSILAFLPPAEIELAIVDGERSPATGQPLPRREKLIAELSEIRRRRYVLTSGQKLPGAVGMGVPIFSPNRRVIGSLCITVPKIRFMPDDEPKLAALLMAQAGDLHCALGHEDDPIGDCTDDKPPVQSVRGPLLSRRGAPAAREKRAVSRRSPSRPQALE